MHKTSRNRIGKCSPSIAIPACNVPILFTSLIAAKAGSTRSNTGDAMARRARVVQRHRREERAKGLVVVQKGWNYWEGGVELIIV